ncbi:helix-turn-helix domain-containing protein [Streptomyces sp. NPDC021212]|uniref:helix-turn-helix domain-containing protein n=1 Tax=Streptomyces sp. NPDC021212 TaxID=3365118 RepID=UPI0037993122
MGSTNEELIDEFGDALDKWASEVKEVCRALGVQQQQLASRLTELSKLGGVSPSRVSKWLSGRKIITTGGAALPGKGLSQDIVRALGLQGAQARRVMQLGERVDLVQVQLERRYPTGWRVAAQAHFRNSSVAALHSSSSADAEAAPSACEAPPPSPSAAGHRQNTPEAPGPPLARTTTTAPAAAADEETSARPPLVTGDGSPGTPRRSWRRRLQPDRPGWIKAWGSVTAAAAALAIVTAAVVGADGDEETRSGSEGGTPQTSAPASQAPSPQEGPGTVPSESPGLEKGTLGEDSRCSVPFAGPGATAWRVCARVETERVSFALKITNHASRTTTVRIRLEYAQANKFHPCPKTPSTHPLDIAAGKTVITAPRQCTVPREEAPSAYQGVGWVVAEDANAGSYKLSPTANVYPDRDRVIWQPDLV